jgi:hypothetical protein
MLTCKTCGAVVNQVDGLLKRTCEHNDAPIVANMQASAKGTAVLK